MKIKLGTNAVLPFFDSTAVIALASFTVQVDDPSGATVATAGMTAVTDIPDLYLSEPVLFSKVGQYTLTYTYDVDVVKQSYVDVGAAPISDYPRAVPTTLRLDQREVGGPAETVTVQVIDQAGDTAFGPTNAPYVAGASGYEVAHTFLNQEQYFIVWFTGAPATPFSMEPALVLTPAGAETCRFTVATLEGNNGQPHIGTTVLASLSDGTAVAQALTDIEGEAVLNLDPTNYVISLEKSGVVFSKNNFTLEVINSREISSDPLLYSPEATEIQAFQIITGSFTPTFTAPISPAPMCQMFADIYRMSGKPLSHANVQVRLLHTPQLFSGVAVFDTQATYRTDGSGHVEFMLVQGVKIEVIIAPLSLRRIITVPKGDDAVDPNTGQYIPINLIDLMSNADDVFDIIKAEIPAAPRRTL
jgi:hypothetical protein